ncbi:MAG: tyrosine-type recombinase/integrase [Actinomycetota bacterium]|nr:tyrosine-type recombinase/integrase [Actinomycetota bacterium]
MNALTLPELIDTLLAARRAGGFRYDHQARMLAQFAEHCSRDGYADGSIIQEAVEGFLYGRHLKASTIRREEIILRDLAQHARQFGWPAWAPPTLTRVKTGHRPPPYVFSDDEICRLFHAIDTQSLSEMSNRALIDPVLFRVLYATGMRISEALNLKVRDFDPARVTIEVRDSKNRENRVVPITTRLTATLQDYIAAAHPDPEPAHHLFHTGDSAKPARQIHDLQPVAPLPRRRGHSPFRPGRPAHPFAASRLRRAEPAPLGEGRQRPGGDAALPVRVHGPRRPARNPVLPAVDCGRVPRGRRDGPSQIRVRHPGPRRARRSRTVSRVTPAGGDLAGRWLSKFLTDHLAGERDLSPQTIASYRDAIKLLLTWFRDVQATPPEKLRLADLDRARVLAFLDWLQTERRNSPATRNQRLAVIKSLARYTAIERPEFLDQAIQILAIKQKKTAATDMGHLTGDEVKALLTEPDPTTRRGLRDTVLLCTLYDTAARVQEICDLNTADVRTARPMLVTLHGKGSKTRRVPLMDPTARLLEDYLDRRAPHRGVGTDADPLFNGPEHTRLTRWGVTKILARHVQSLRRHDPDYAPGLNITPHVIRRTRAMHLLQAKVNLIYIRDLLGHADISTTEIYARADADAKRKAIESAYPSLTPEPLPNWTVDQDLLDWLDHVSE